MAIKIAHAAAGRRVAFGLSDAFCIDRYRDEFLGLVRDGSIDILFANEAELHALYQTADFDTAVAELRNENILAVVTRSERGAARGHPRRDACGQGLSGRESGRHHRSGRSLRRRLPHWPCQGAGLERLRQARRARRGRDYPALRRAAADRSFGAGRGKWVGVRGRPCRRSEAIQCSVSGSLRRLAPPNDGTYGAAHNFRNSTASIEWLASLVSTRLARGRASAEYFRCRLRRLILVQMSRAIGLRLGFAELGIFAEIGTRIAKRCLPQPHEARDDTSVRDRLRRREDRPRSRRSRTRKDRPSPVFRRAPGQQHVQALDDENVRPIDHDAFAGHHVIDEMRIDRRADVALCRPSRRAKSAAERRAVVALGKSLLLHQAFGFRARRSDRETRRS